MAIICFQRKGFHTAGSLVAPSSGHQGEHMILTELSFPGPDLKWTKLSLGYMGLLTGHVSVLTIEQQSDSSGLDDTFSSGREHHIKP